MKKEDNKTLEEKIKLLRELNDQPKRKQLVKEQRNRVLNQFYEIKKPNVRP